MAKSERVLATLTAEEARVRPDWTEPVNGTESQKRKWRMHMTTWTHDRLNEKNDAGPGPESHKALLDSIANGDWAIDAAEHGNIAPLQAQFPHLAKFLKAPEVPRGKHPRPEKVDVHTAARWALQCIRNEIWPKYFGKKNRPIDDSISAEQIAAEWLDADVDEINWKPSGKHRAPRRKSRA